MIKTKYTGVFYRETKAGDRIFYLRGKLKGKVYSEKVGSKSEGVTAAYASQVRNEKHSLSRMGEKSPKHKEVKLTLDEGEKVYSASIAGKSDTRNNQRRYENHIKEVLGSMQMEEITTQDIEKFVALKEKEVSFKTGRPYAPKTINDMVNIISAIYNYNKMVSPAKGLKRAKVDDARERYLTENEIALLLKAITEHPKMRKKELATLFVKIALTTGARLSSILSITQGDILGDRIRIKDHKNNSTYYAALHPSVKAILPEGLSPIQYIIGGGIEPMHRVQIGKMIKPVLDETFNEGLAVDDAKRRVVVHTFRHTFGSLLAIKGTPIYTIKKLMNHSDIKMTMRYAKLSPDVGFDAVMGLTI